jgi:serine phosphatase RsbU (regulator of sigma subunit)
MPYEWLLRPGRYIIGRNPDCDLTIEDDTVSRKHAEIIIGNDHTIILADLGSHNGTIVNGERISESVILQVNDEICFGEVAFRLFDRDDKSLPARSTHISEIEHDLSRATIYPIKTTLRPLPRHFFDNPRLFGVFSEMGKMLVLPGLNNAIYDRALHLLSELIPGERFAIFSIDEEKDDIQLAASHFMTENSRQTFVISRTIVNLLIHEKNAAVIPNLITDEQFRRQESIVRSGARSMMAVPLIDEERLVGILYADTTDPQIEFSEDVLRVMATFGNMLAAKINNYNLLQERREKEAIEAELAIASQIQKELLPQKIPQVERYYIGAFQAQCEQVGGDLYDVCLLKDGRVIFLIADVSDKGIGAALLASDVLASFRVLYELESLELFRAVFSVSRQLLQHSRPGDFATIFIGILDPANDQLKYINAGHCSPIIMRCDGQIEHLECTGAPVGIADTPEWKEECATLKAGDFLFAYTDGITEASQASGSQFGDERLEEFLRKFENQELSELPLLLQGEIRKFLGSTPGMLDDTTMLIIGRRQ